MMSIRQWFVLFAIYIVFMLIGSVVFMELEQPHELRERAALQSLKGDVIGVVGNLNNDSKAEVENTIRDIGDVCGHDFLHLVEDDPMVWSLWNTFFFTFTVITTIGFGHMSPSTAWGKIFCILYATVGVPLNGILIASLADIFSSKVVNSRVRARAKSYQSSWMAVAADTAFCVLPGFIIFLVIPAVILYVVEEGWDYLDSFYYAFITLTTIGFGDYVGGRQETDFVLVWLYKIISFLWITFGLGYIIAAITFIQKALKCKKIHNIERKMAKALKKHANKMNENVHRDLKRIRKIINTISNIQEEDQQNLEDEKPKKSGGGDLKTNEKALLAAGLKPESVDADRVFLSHQNSPDLKKSKKKLGRSASDASSTRFSKNKGLPHPNCMGDINIFLDMVETLLREHEAEAAKMADDEAHQFMEETTGNSDDDSNSGEGDSEKPVAEFRSIDPEAGFVNPACTDDDGNVIFTKSSVKETDHGRDKRSDTLQKKISNFFGVPELQTVRDTEVPGLNQKCSTTSDLLDMVENLISQPTPLDKLYSFGNKEPVNFTVPGHFRTPSEHKRMHVYDVFRKSSAANSNDERRQSSTSSSYLDTISSTSSDRRRWSLSDPSHNTSGGIETLTEEDQDTKTSEQFQVLPSLNLADSHPRQKGDSEGHNPENTRF